MMITVYVDWENHKILTMEQFEEEVALFVKELKNDNYEYNDDDADRYCE